MKRFLLLCTALLCYLLSEAQIKNPVNWTTSVKKLNATTYEVRLTARIEAGWHLYSQTTPAGGPVKTTFTFLKNPLLSVQGMPREVGNIEQRHEELFGVDVKQFSNKVEFVQTVKLKAPAKTSLTGNVEFMVCNDKECLPPKTENFSVALQ